MIVSECISFQGSVQLMTNLLLKKTKQNMASGISVTQLCLTLCDPMDFSMPGLSVHHQLPGPTQTHAH